MLTCSFCENCLLIQVIFEAVVGDGFLGDIAIDEVTLSTASCNTVPNSAKPGVSSLSGKCLKIVDHSISGIYVIHFKGHCNCLNGG